MSLRYKKNPHAPSVHGIHPQNTGPSHCSPEYVPLWEAAQAHGSIDITEDDVIVEFGNNKNCRIPMRKTAIAEVEKPELVSSEPKEEKKKEEKKK